MYAPLPGQIFTQISPIAPGQILTQITQMTNPLGSVGSKDFESAAAAETEAQLSASDDPHSLAIRQTHELFQSPKTENHALAMKLLFAMMSKGVDASEFAPQVVQQVASQDAVARQLAYVYLNHYAEEAPETSLLSVNTFKRSLTDSDQLVRALAVKVLSSIRSKEILPSIQDAVNQVIGDTSPYVKKAAAYAMIKAVELDPTQVEGFIPLIGRLLGDSSPIAFGGAIAAYLALCPDNIELIHPHFRNICQNVSKLDEWAQVSTLRVLTRYSRYCFRSPEAAEADESQIPAGFWDEDPQKIGISSDHLHLIHTAKQLLASPNAAVVMASVSLLFYVAPSSHISCVARPLVRLLYDSQTTAQLALSTILTIASVHRHIFVPHLNHFFIRKVDTRPVKQLKLRVMSFLASASNAVTVLTELSSYTGSSDIEFAATAVKTMGKTAMCNEGIIPHCLASLIKLLGRAEGTVLSQVVLVTSHLLRRRSGSEDEAQALRQLCRKFIAIKDASARSAVLSIVGDMHETHGDFAPQLLRHIANGYAEEQGTVRLQALTLAAKLIALGTTSKVPLYVLKIGERDAEYDVRDRARFLLALVQNDADEIRGNLRALLFPARKPPQWTAIDAGCSEFQIGTFSHFFDRAVGDYEPLPDWAAESELPDESVRSPQAGREGFGDGGTDADGALDINDWLAGPAPGEDDEKSYYSGYYSDEEEEERRDEGLTFFD
jgi:AP-3 complex subunit beta